MINQNLDMFHAPYGLDRFFRPVGGLDAIEIGQVGDTCTCARRSGTRRCGHAQQAVAGLTRRDGAELADLG